jgi:hypothetical protein
MSYFEYTSRTCKQSFRAIMRARRAVFVDLFRSAGADPYADIRGILK